MNLDKLRRRREEKFFKVGGGVWFHNATHEQIYVEVSFYPKLKLRLGEKEISKDFLKDCHRVSL